MSIRRIMPDIHVESGEALTANRAFYGLLCFEEVMDMGLGTVAAELSRSDFW